MELGCVCECLLKHLTVLDDPENARLILYRCLWGLGEIKLFESFPTRGPGEERANVIGSLPIAYFKHHYSFTAL